MDLRPLTAPPLVRFFGVASSLAFSTGAGLSGSLGPSVTLLTAAGDTIFPVGTPFGVVAKFGVCGVILFPDGFFQVQIR